MNISGLIRAMVESRNETQLSFSARIGISRQALTNRLRENTWTVSDVAKYGDMLEYDIQITATDRKTGKRITIDIPIEQTKQD